MKAHDMKTLNDLALAHRKAWADDAARARVFDELESAMHAAGAYAVAAGGVRAIWDSRATVTDGDRLALLGFAESYAMRYPCAILQTLHTEPDPAARARICDRADAKARDRAARAATEAGEKKRERFARINAEAAKVEGDALAQRCRRAEADTAILAIAERQKARPKRRGIAKGGRPPKDDPVIFRRAVAEVLRRVKVGALVRPAARAVQDDHKLKSSAETLRKAASATVTAKARKRIARVGGK